MKPGFYQIVSDGDGFKALPLENAPVFLHTEDALPGDRVNVEFILRNGATYKGYYHRPHFMAGRSRYVPADAANGLTTDSDVIAWRLLEPRHV